MWLRVRGIAPTGLSATILQDSIFVTFWTKKVRYAAVFFNIF